MKSKTIWGLVVVLVLSFITINKVIASDTVQVYISAKRSPINVVSANIIDINFIGANIEDLSLKNLTITNFSEFEDLRDIIANPVLVTFHNTHDTPDLVMPMTISSDGRRLELDSDKPIAVGSSLAIFTDVLNNKELIKSSFRVGFESAADIQLQDTSNNQDLEITFREDGAFSPCTGSKAPFMGRLTCPVLFKKNRNDSPYFTYSFGNLFVYNISLDDPTDEAILNEYLYHSRDWTAHRKYFPGYVLEREYPDFQLARGAFEYTNKFQGIPYNLKSFTISSEGTDVDLTKVISNPRIELDERIPGVPKAWGGWKPLATDISINVTKDAIKVDLAQPYKFDKYSIKTIEWTLHADIKPPTPRINGSVPFYFGSAEITPDQDLGQELTIGNPDKRNPSRLLLFKTPVPQVLIGTDVPDEADVSLGDKGVNIADFDIEVLAENNEPVFLKEFKFFIDGDMDAKKLFNKVSLSIDSIKGSLPVTPSISSTRMRFIVHKPIKFTPSDGKINLKVKANLSENNSQSGKSFQLQLIKVFQQFFMDFRTKNIRDAVPDLKFKNKDLSAPIKDRDGTFYSDKLPGKQRFKLTKFTVN